MKELDSIPKKESSLEPIAIVGIGCRFPGNANNPDTFWDLLKDGKDGVREVPEERWSIKKFYSSDPNEPGKMYTKSGSYLHERIDQFDAQFFGISPREAACLDPQQRILLEVAWEALEDAGIVPSEIAGSDTGVFIGGFLLDAMINQMGAMNLYHAGPHTAVSSTLTILSNRLSFFFDLHGPSLSMDTACSSSLVAFHYACQSIWWNECSMALTGGSNIMFRPEFTVAMCKGQFLSRDGRSKSFDARADGYGRGEGAGIVVLKKLSNAVKDGNTIYAIVRATGVNHDGRTSSITIPNPDAQEQLIQQVIEKANVSSGQIWYVEAHGTGTPTGDPIEASSIGNVIGKNRSSENPCFIGSVKANIGHLEAASGVAAVIKSVLCLKNKKLPPVANLDKPNPKIPFDYLGLHLPTKLEPFPEGNGNAIIGVNSFGYGGTSAHAIIEEAPKLLEPDITDDISQKANRPFLFPISARNDKALINLANLYMALLKKVINSKISIS